MADCGAGASCRAGRLRVDLLRAHRPHVSKHEFYFNTGLGPRADTLGRGVYEPRPEHVTLLLARGEKKDFFTTDTGVYEAVAVEIPQPRGGERIELTDPNVRAGFIAAHGGGKIQWKLGASGIKGQLQIQLVTSQFITMRYDVWVDSYFDGNAGPAKRAMTFHGEATLRERPPGYGKIMGYLSPR